MTSDIRGAARRGVGEVGVRECSSMAAAPAHQGTVRAADTELAYLRIGAGTPMVVMPGGPRLGFAHLRVGFDRLADACELVYYDERGSGASPLGDPSRVSTSGTLEDLDALLAGLGIDRAILAGHSISAHMVALYAATRPERALALVLANPGPPLVPELMEQFGKEMASRRSAEDVEEMKRIEGSAEYEAREPQTLERHYRLRYGPFFRDRENALQADFGLTQITAENVVEARSVCSAISATTLRPRSWLRSRVPPSWFTLSWIRFRSSRRGSSPMRFRMPSWS
jgi:proline iminopeptidase